MDNTLRMILGAIITIILAWVILSLLLIWARPSLYNANGAVNWWTTLWVTIVTVIILWIVLFILYLITRGNSDACCEYQQGNYNSQSGNWGYQSAAYLPQPGGNIVAQAGSNVVAPQGSNVLAQPGSNILSQAGNLTQSGNYGTWPNAW